MSKVEEEGRDEGRKREKQEEKEKNLEDRNRGERIYVGSLMEKLEMR